MAWRDTLRSTAGRATGAMRSILSTAVTSAADLLKLEDKPLGAPMATPSMVPVLVDWDVVDVREALRLHELGVFRMSGLLADHMGRNDRIQSVLRTRMYAALSLPFAMAPTEAPGSDALALRLTPRWKRMMSRSVAASVIRDCALMGFCICQRIWTRDERTGEWGVTLKRWHPCWIRWDWTLQVFVIQTREGPEYCPPDSSNPRWALFVELDDDRPWMAASIRSLAIPFLIVNWADRDWARWSEKHGLPPLGAKVPNDQRNSKSTERFLDELQELATEPSIMLPQFGQGEASFDIEWKELKNWQSYEGFQALADRQDKRFAITLLGQNLTTDVTGGSYAAATAHQLVRQDYLEADALLISGGGRQHLTVPWTVVNVDPDPIAAEALAPCPTWDPTPPEDAKLSAETSTANANAAKAWREAGASVDANAEAKKAGVTLAAAPAPTTPTG